VRKVVFTLLLALVLAGCGGGRGSASSKGTATLWVTRDRGSQVLFAGRVPAGLSAMQALERKLKVTTRYGGRFAQSIDGVSGSVSSQHDWFYFVNGIEADTSAAAVRLRAGDVEWWDYRSWAGSAMSVPVVAGAFPEPFVHGFDWARPGAAVTGGAPSVAKLLAREVHGRVGTAKGSSNRITIDAVSPPGMVEIARHGNGVWLTLGTAAAARLAHDPHALRFRYGTTE
jgi:hypothetical protein